MIHGVFGLVTNGSFIIIRHKSICVVSKLGHGLGVTDRGELRQFVYNVEV